MKHYVFNGELYGIKRKLSIVGNGNNIYSIYWDAHKLGVIYAEYDERAQDAIWITDDFWLKEYVNQLGDYIEMCKLMEEEDE